MQKNEVNRKPLNDIYCIFKGLLKLNEMKDDRFIRFVDLMNMGNEKPEIIRKLGISERTFYRYQSQYNDDGYSTPTIRVRYFTHVINGYVHKDYLAQSLEMNKKTLIKMEKESFSCCISNLLYRSGRTVAEIAKALHMKEERAKTLIVEDSTLSDAENIINDIIKEYAKYLDVPIVMKKHNILLKINNDLRKARL